MDSVADHVRYIRGPCWSHRIQISETYHRLQGSQTPTSHISQIVGAVENSTGYFRQVVAMTEHVPNPENMPFPNIKPNFVLVDVLPTLESLSISQMTAGLRVY